MHAEQLDRLIQPGRLHGDLYRDPAIFAEEIERIFHRGWVFVGHEGEIPSSGDFVQRSLGTQPVIFVRGADGVARVLLNRCTHRANAVCHLDRGNTPAFTCAYHGWRFRNDGELAVVTFPDRYDESFDKAALGLRSPPHVASHRGFVFASLDPASRPLAQHLGTRVMAEVDDIADLAPTGRLLANAGAHKTRYAGNWKHQIENSLDGYHAMFVHRSQFEVRRLRTGREPVGAITSKSAAWIRDLGNGHCAWGLLDYVRELRANAPGAATPGPDYKAYAAAVRERLGEERSVHVLEKGGAHLFVFPNLVFIGNHIRRIEPVGVDETRVQLIPVLLDGAPTRINRERLRQHEDFYGPAGGGQPDDIEIFERNQIGLAAEADPWSLITRGQGEATTLDDGTRQSQITDELSNRAIFDRWREMMAEAQAS